MFSRLFGSGKKKDETPRPPKPKSDSQKIDEKLRRAVGEYVPESRARTESERIAQALEHVENFKEKLKEGDQFLTIADFSRLATELQSEGVIVTSYELQKRARLIPIATESNQKSRYGDINPNAECIFCGATGGVRVKIASVTEQYRMNSVAGAALGVGVNSEKNKIQRHCDKCSKTWHE